MEAVLGGSRSWGDLYSSAYDRVGEKAVVSDLWEESDEVSFHDVLLQPFSRVQRKEELCEEGIKDT